MTVRDDAGNPVDLTGASIRWQMAKHPESAALVTKSNNQGIAVTDEAGGAFEIELASADTEALVGKYYHEGEIVDAGGAVSTVLSGNVTIVSTLIKSG